MTLTLLAVACPKEAFVAPMKPVPTIVTLLPPVFGPLFGLMAVIVGGGVVYVN